MLEQHRTQPKAERVIYLQRPAKRFLAHLPDLSRYHSSASGLWRFSGGMVASTLLVKDGLRPRWASAAVALDTRLGCDGRDPFEPGRELKSRARGGRLDACVCPCSTHTSRRTAPASTTATQTAARVASAERCRRRTKGGGLGRSRHSSIDGTWSRS